MRPVAWSAGLGEKLANGPPRLSGLPTRPRAKHPARPRHAASASASQACRITTPAQHTASPAAARPRGGSAAFGKATAPGQSLRPRQLWVMIWLRTPNVKAQRHTASRSEAEAGLPAGAPCWAASRLRNVKILANTASKVLIDFSVTRDGGRFARYAINKHRVALPPSRNSSQP